VRPQAHGSLLIEPKSPVRYLMSGNAWLFSSVTTSSPDMPVAHTVSPSRISTIMFSSLRWSEPLGHSWAMVPSSPHPYSLNTGARNTSCSSIRSAGVRTSEVVITQAGVKPKAVPRDLRKRANSVSMETYP